MKRIVAIILIILASSVVGVYSYADYEGALIGTNMSDKTRALDLYIDDRAEYPYVVIGRIVIEGLVSSETRRRLKAKAVTVGADAVLNYQNRRGNFGFTAEGVAVRWRRSGEDGPIKIPDSSAIPAVE